MDLDGALLLSCCERSQELCEVAADGYPLHIVRFHWSSPNTTAADVHRQGRVSVRVLHVSPLADR